MSTRCFIGIKTGLQFEKIIGIYCHHDGYPSWFGRKLTEHYNHESKIWALLGRGDISGLDETPEKSDSYFYNSKGEDFSAPQVFSDVNEVYKHHSDYEYAYVFDPNLGKWFFCTYRDHDLRELTMKIIEED